MKLKKLNCGKHWGKTENGKCSKCIAIANDDPRKAGWITFRNAMKKIS